MTEKKSLICNSPFFIVLMADNSRKEGFTCRYIYLVILHFALLISFCIFLISILTAVYRNMTAPNIVLIFLKSIYRVLLSFLLSLRIALLSLLTSKAYIFTSSSFPHRKFQSISDTLLSGLKAVSVFLSELNTCFSISLDNASAIHFCTALHILSIN